MNKTAKIIGAIVCFLIALHVARLSLGSNLFLVVRVACIFCSISLLAAGYWFFIARNQALSDKRRISLGLLICCSAASFLTAKIYVEKHQLTAGQILRREAERLDAAIGQWETNVASKANESNTNAPFQKP